MIQHYHIVVLFIFYITIYIIAYKNSIYVLSSIGNNDLVVLREFDASTNS